MKRTVCLILSILMLLTVCACGKEEKKKDAGDTVDLEYFVRLGKIPECDFAVGADADEIAAKEDAMESEGFRYICIAYNNSNYYYKKEEEKIITYVVSYNGAYGFKQGDQAVSIKDELAKGGYTEKEEPLTEDDTFFIPVNGDFTGIKYTFGEYTTCFVFKAGALCACTIYESVDK